MKQLVGLTLAAVLIGGGCTCLDTSGFHPYACEVDGGADQCPGGGVCGLEGICHASGDEQAWQCQDDSHCEGTWRCGPDGFCLNPEREALVPATADLLAAARIGHLLPEGLPSRVAGSSTTAFISVPTCYGSGTPVGEYDTHELTAQVAAVVLDGGLYTVVRWSPSRPALPDGGFLKVTDCEAYPDGRTPSQAIDVVQVPAPSMVDLAAHAGVTYVLKEGGVVCRYRLGHLLTQEPAGECSEVFSSSAPPQRLRLTEDMWWGGPLLVGVGPDHVQLHDLSDGGSDSVRRIALPDGGNARIHDAIAYGTSERLLLAATAEGLFAQRLDGVQISDGGLLKDENHWEQVATQFGTFCGENLAGIPPATPLRLGFSDFGSTLVAHYRTDYPDGTFDEQLMTLVMQRLVDQTPPGGECVLAPMGVNIGAPEGPLVYSPWVRCQPCPANSELRWYRLGGFQSHTDTPTLEARCSNPDGGSDLIGVDTSGRCEPFGTYAAGLGLDAPLEGARHNRPVIVDTSSVQGLTVADDLGHLWQPQGAWTLYPWTLDTAPWLVFRDPPRLMAVRGVELHGHSEEVSAPLVVLEQLVMEEGPRGYTRTGEDFQIRGAVQGQPHWLLVQEFREVGSPLMGVLELLEPGARGAESASQRALAYLPSGLPFGEPTLLTTARTPVGGTVLLLTSGDTLLAADLSQSLASVPPGPYDPAEFLSAPVPAVKFTAMVHAPVQALVALAPRPGGPFVEGYLVQGFRLFHFEASGINVWRTRELILQDTTEPLAVFADGVRGRLGMKNGTVYSLPSQLRLADPLPELAQPVSSYQQHCGHLFAVGADGLYRLAVGAEPKGSWEAVAIPAHHRFAGGKLFSEGEDLRFFTADGVGMAVTGFTCRAPAAE